MFLQVIMTKILWQPDNQKKKKQCQHTCAYKALFVNAPDEVTTLITPGRLTEVCRYKSMSMTGDWWAVQMYELQLITDTGVTGTSLQRDWPPSRPNFWQRVHTRLWRNQILPAACRVARQRLVHPINSSYMSGKNWTSRVRYYWWRWLRTARVRHCGNEARLSTTLNSSPELNNHTADKLSLLTACTRTLLQAQVLVVVLGWIITFSQFQIGLLHNLRKRSFVTSTFIGIHRMTVG